MIQLFGTLGRPEYNAALSIKTTLERLWPGISETPAEEDSIKVFSGLKLAGYKVSDIDIVLAGRLNTSRYIVPRVMYFGKDGERVSGQKVRVRSFVAAIEVKSHDASGIKIEAGGVSVRYCDGWKSATEQNEDQRYALLHYLKDLHFGNPWVYRCLLLQGIPELPSHRGRTMPAAGAVASDFDATQLFLAMAGVNGVPKIAGEYAISSGDHTTMGRIVDAPIFTPMVPSLLDRHRMDILSSRPPLAKKISGGLGDSPIQLRGQGGAGKTVLMLQAAHEAFVRYGKRCLVLTYNHALAADIQRLLAMKGIPDGSDGGGIEVRTVMSFVYTWLNRLGLIESDDVGEFEEYDTHCKQALEWISTGAISKGDIDGIKASNRVAMDPDVILVDEAQDWPQDEATLLCQLYGANRLLLADGISQLVRGNASDWRQAMDGVSHEVLFLEECLRMKANLAMFANALAKQVRLNWEVSPSRSASGGRVIVTYVPYAGNTSLRLRLVEAASSAGNAPVDLLHCVPAGEVSLRGNQHYSQLGEILKGEGKIIWDGVDPRARRDYPRSINAFRIVQYDSCRGLEGWVTVLDGLDAFWDWKKVEAMNSLDTEEAACNPSGLESRAAAIAWRWVMIALTRPIDTLVITIREQNSEVGKVLSAIAAELPDIVEVQD